MQTRGDLQTWERGTPAVEALSGALVPPRDEDGVGVIVPGGDCEWQVVTRGTSPALRTLRLPSGSVVDLQHVMGLQGLPKSRQEQLLNDFRGRKQQPQ